MDKIINEIFEKYQIRKSKKQKTAFIEYISELARNEGWAVNIEKGSFGVRNIVLGDPNSAKLIYAAHYDTCSRLPFPNFLTPKNIGVYVLYNLAIVIGFLAVAFVLGFLLGMLGVWLNMSESLGAFAAEIAYFAILVLLFCGPANKHTANDNTSGVTVLLGIMKSLPAELRDKAAIVFFDQEEMGLLGSEAFAKKHKNVRQNTPLINFDCVSDGENILIVTKKDAQRYSQSLSDAFVSGDDVCVELTNKAFYPSDQAKFKFGVGVASFKKTKRGTLYMNRIHTDKDTVYRRENIDFLVSGAVKLAEII